MENIEVITGSCTGHENPDLWFTEIPIGRPTARKMIGITGDIKKAIKICNACPSKDACLEEGMKDDNISNGIWGGKLAGERINKRFPDGFNRNWTIKEGLGRDMYKAITFLKRVEPWIKE